MNPAEWYGHTTPEAYYYDDEYGRTHLYVSASILTEVFRSQPPRVSLQTLFHLTSHYGILQPGNIRPTQTTKAHAMSLSGIYKHFHNEAFGRSTGNSFVPYNPFAVPLPRLTKLLLMDTIGDGTSFLTQIKMDPAMNILQIKGWGSGIQQTDYDNLFFRGIDVNLSQESFLNAVEAKIGPMLVPHLGKDQQYWLQWDGDRIEFETYGYLLAAVAYMLDRYNKLHGLICMKLTDEDKAENFAESFMKDKGGHHLQRLCPNLPMILVAYPFENDPEVEAEQHRTGFGFYGACLNNIFTGPKTIVAFGGGPVLSAEEANGYDVNTRIIRIDMTRKGGTEKSRFTSDMQGLTTGRNGISWL